MTDTRTRRLRILAELIRSGAFVSQEEGSELVVTKNEADRGKFKTPSLRNVALTAPYMHDGRFRTLEEVVDHYDHGVKRTPNLDPNLAKHPDSGLGLSAADKQALVAFLKTLTDASFVPSATHTASSPR